jgi:mRNA interferase YafQ
LTVKKLPASKRTNLPRVNSYSRAFLKDWPRLSASGRFDMRRLKEVLLLLISNDGPLPPEFLDHALKGKWADHRECHVGGDFLLIYLTHGDAVMFVRTGTHSEIFAWSLKNQAKE